jgi:hypothetical protein
MKLFLDDKQRPAIMLDDLVRSWKDEYMIEDHLRGWSFEDLVNRSHLKP